MKPFIHKQAFHVKDIIKSLGGRWDNEKKQWMVDEHHHAKLHIEAERISKRNSKLWERACTMENFNKVCKDTPEYEQVKQRYIQLIDNYTIHT